MTASEILLRTPRFNVVSINVPGRDGKVHAKAFIDHPGAVVLLPLLDDNTVLLIENERPAVGETLLELPAGTRDPDERPLATAARELTEETGYTAGRLELLTEFYSAPGLGNERMFLVLARDLTPGAQQLESTERIINRPKTREEVRQLLANHQIRDAKTLIGLHHFLYPFQRHET